MARQQEIARKNFELENQVISDDQIYGFNEEENDKLVDSAPWKKDPHYFKGCKISAVALIKMVMHAKSGGNLEVMGLM
jgi:COP9 signalosome complex subunit 5